MYVNWEWENTQIDVKIGFENTASEFEFLLACENIACTEFFRHIKMYLKDLYKLSSIERHYGWWFK